MNRDLFLFFIFIGSWILLFDPDPVMDDLFTNTMAIELENKFPPNIGIRVPLLHEV